MMDMRKVVGMVALAAILGLPCVSAHAQTWGSGASAPTSGDCDPAVQTQQDQAARTAMSNYANLASNLYKPMASNFETSSCLNNLMNSGINIIFNPPSIDSILSGILNGLCQYAKGLVQQQLGSLTSSLSGSIPMGSIIPGVNLGGLNSGFSIGSGGSGGISVNGQPVTGNLAGYWGSSLGSTSSYGSLFGSSGQPATGSGGWFSGIF
jgi:hypothetical protein